MQTTKTYKLLLDVKTDKFELIPTYTVSFIDESGNLYYMVNPYKKPVKFNLDIIHDRNSKDYRIYVYVSEDRFFEGFKRIISYLKEGQRIGIFKQMLLFFEYLKVT